MRGPVTGAETWGTPPNDWNPPPRPGQARPTRRWRWRAKTRTGERVAGELRAESAEEVREKLLSWGHLALEVTPAPGAFSWRWWVTARERHLFGKLLGTMRGVGLTLEQCLTILADESSPPVARRIACGLRRLAARATEVAALEAMELLPR